jgi:hypothetical protein
LSEILTGLRVIAAQEKKLHETKRLAIKHALANGLTRAQVADALGISVDQLVYLDGTTPSSRAKRARPSDRQGLPGISAAEYASLHGLTRDAVQKKLKRGEIRFEDVPNGRRTLRRIIAG